MVTLTRLRSERAALGLVATSSGSQSGVTREAESPGGIPAWSSLSFQPDLPTVWHLLEARGHGTAHCYSPSRSVFLAGEQGRWGKWAWKAQDRCPAMISQPC